MRLADIGEDGLIDEIARLIGLGGLNYDNDVSYVALPDGTYLVIKIDGGSLARTKASFMTYYDVGWRMAVGALSDMAAKLARPSAVVASFTLPGSLNHDYLMELVKGIRDASASFKAQYIGGDLNEGQDEVVDIAAVGFSKVAIGRIPRVGDVLVTLPIFGYTGLVFKLYYLGTLDKYSSSQVVSRAIEYTRRPPAYSWVIDSLEGLANCISASMDSSDGLGQVLATMGKYAKIELTQLPAAEGVQEFCRGINIDLDEVVLNGGEEYAPVFSIRPSCLRDFEALGFVKIADVKEGRGVFWRGVEVAYRGWRYFNPIPYK